MQSPIYVLEEASYTSEYGKPVVLLYSRPLNNKRELVTHKIRGFRPYFYIPANEIDHATSDKITEISDTIELDALGREVRKCYTRMPMDVRDVRDDFSFTDMSDFLFEKRYIIDKKLTYAYTWNGVRPLPVTIDSILPPRTVYFDIEVLSPEGIFPDVDKTKYPVIMVQLLDTYTNKKLIITNGIPKVADDQIACRNEHELFTTFMEYLKRVDPDLLTGWNCLPGKTRVFTKNGFKSISELSEGEYLHDDSKILKHAYTGDKKIVSLKTRIGWSIESSEEHKFLIRKVPNNRKYVWKHTSNYLPEWKEAKHIEKGDMICCPFGKGKENKNNKFNPNDLYMMGFIYADGTLSDKWTYMLYNKDKSLIERLKLPDKKMWFSKGVWCTKIARKYYKHVENFIVSDKTGKKEINIELLSKLSLEEFCAFISGWYDGDGSFSSEDMFKICDDSRGHQDLCKLFLHFGILSSYGSRNHYNFLQALPEVWKYIRKYSFYPSSIKNRNVRHRSAELKETFRYGFTNDFSEVNIGIESLDYTNKYESCYDIETSSHQFNIGCIVHNCSRFDLPYLIRRAEKIHVSVKELGRNGTPRCTFDKVSMEYRCHIKGRSTLDMLEAYKKYMIMKSQKESYDLKSISASYNFSYTDYGPRLQMLIDKQDYKTLIEYGRNDVLALQNIENQTGIIAFYENLRMIAGTRLDDTLHNSTIIEMLLLHNGIKPMPRKTQLYGKKEKFKGATVVLPPKGIHDWVATVDLASLYPTIMQAFPNETCPDIDLKVIEVLKIMFDKRNELRYRRLHGDHNPALEFQEQGYKVIANSFYGVCGAPTFRLYKRECAEFVTKKGREVNLFMREKIMAKNKSILYSDSVASNSKVKIYDENLDPTVIEIKDLFTKADIIDKRTGKEYCLLDNTFVESVDHNGRVILDNVKCIMRHKCKKQMYRVFTDSVHHIDVTEDHSLVVYDSQKNMFVDCLTKDLGTKYESVILKYKVSDQFDDWICSGKVRIEKIDYDDYVYDLTTVYTHRFFVNDILAHNTDSSFFSEIESVEEGLEMQNYLNAELKKWGDSQGAKIDFTLKFEKYFRKLLFKEKKSGEAAKKKYAGHLLWEEGEDQNKLCYKGIEVTRSDNPIILKTLLKDFLELLLINDDPDAAIKLIQDTCMAVRSGNVEIYDVSIPKAVRKAASGDNPWKRGIENTKHTLNYIIPVECKPRLIYLKRSPHELCIDDEVDINSIKDIVDWDKTFKKVLEDKLETYVESAGFFWDHFIHNQQTLDQWFN